MQKLQELISSHQEWLVKRTEEIAQERGWNQGLITLETACRSTVTGLSRALLEALKQGALTSDVNPCENTATDDLSAFVLREARLHRARGVTLPSFLSALKCCRKAFLDLAREHQDPSRRSEFHILLNRFFGLVELVVVSKWVGIDEDQLLQELQDGASRYRILARRTTDIIFFIALGTGRILEANEAAQRTFGYSREELLTKTVYDLLNSSVHTDIQQRWGAVRENGAFFEALMCRRDGSIFPVEVTSDVDVVSDEQMVVSIIRDISERKQAEMRLRQAYTELNQIFRAAADGMWVIDTDYRVLRLNQRLAEMLGVDPAAAVGRKCYELMQREDCHNAECPLRCLNGGAGSLEREVEVNRHGERTCFLTSAAALYDADGRFTGVVESLKDITERKRAEEEIRYLSFHDTLTGLYNRAYFEEQLKHVHRVALPCSIILGDLNGLKIVNDAFGHAKGDQFLVETAKILKNACRGEDVVARWGGDEFVILLPGADEQDAQSVVGRIREACAASPIDPIPPTIAMGVGTKLSQGPDVYQALRDAEAGMYRRKLLESDSTRSFSIQSLQRSLQEKSVETEAHAERLRVLAGYLSKVMNLPSSQVDELNILATLHDIGKIAIPDDILNKPGPLTPEEWEIMKRHPVIGYRIARTSQELVSIADGILAHHERWDGKGYPRGLAGERIPLVSRILGVIDAFDAMTNDRPYRRAIPVETALEELKNNAGSQFDPRVVKAFIDSAGKLRTLF